VKTDLFNAKLSVRGGFASEEEDYDPTRHTLHVRMAPAADLRKGVAHDARMEKIRDEEPAPALDRVYDYETRSKNGTVSPGHVAEVKGAYLDYDQADNAQGVYFVDSTNAGFKAEVIHKNNGSTVSAGA
jgi:hypothetical protein